VEPQRIGERLGVSRPVRDRFHRSNEWRMPNAEWRMPNGECRMPTTDCRHKMDVVIGDVP